MKFLTTLIISLLNVSSGFSQTVKDIFNPSTQITWLGIDYSHTKIVGAMDRFGGKTPVTATELRDRYFPEWNMLFIDEPEKYSISKMIYNKNIVNDIKMVTKLNAAYPLDTMEVKSSPYYTPDYITSIVSAYPLENKNGIGLIFITECLDKPYAAAYYHVVFFNMATKEVLLHERIQGMVIGAGIRNYWAGSFFNVMEDVRTVRFPRWKKRYMTALPTNK
jgi:hypothetical protein